MSTIVEDKKSAAGNATKMLSAMVGIGTFCALAIVLTFQFTLPRINANKAEALEKAIFKVIPGTEGTEEYLLLEDNSLQLSNGEKSDLPKVYAGYNEHGNLSGVAIEASGQGYADIIKVLYGYDIQQEKIKGLYVLESKETPGLGDKIEKDADFVANFDGLDVSLKEDGSAVMNRIVTVKHGEKENPWEIDGITGATISSRAIGNILGESTAKWAPLLKNKVEKLSNTSKIKKADE